MRDIGIYMHAYKKKNLSYNIGTCMHTNEKTTKEHTCPFEDKSPLPHRPLYHTDLCTTQTSVPHRPLYHTDLFTTQTSVPNATRTGFHDLERHSVRGLHVPL